MKYAILFAAVLAVVMIPMQAHAFDGQRQGLFAGGGLGIGWADMSGVADGYFQSGSAYGLGTAAKLGFGLSEQLVLFSSDRQTMYRESDGHNVTQGLTALGAMYFLKPTGPSAYFTAEFGSVARSEHTDHVSWFSGSDGQSGAGFGLGGGYEFGNHIAVEGHVSWGDVSDGYGSDPGHRITNIIVTMGWLGF